eukprot:14654738-Alexandrium_andersonii.AAC.1
MSASLVGSEMCIRDRVCPRAMKQACETTPGVIRNRIAEAHQPDQDPEARAQEPDADHRPTPGNNLRTCTRKRVAARTPARVLYAR